jgi:hypothetical protein
MTTNVLSSSPIIQKVLYTEATAMIGDLLDTKLAPLLFSSTKDGAHAAIRKVAATLAEEVNAGHLYVMVIQPDASEDLAAYSIVVPQSKATDPVFIQKIWVREDLRGYGMGSDMMKVIHENAPAGITALVKPSAVGFFEKQGLIDFGHFGGINNNGDFSLSNGLYASTITMATNEKNKAARMFVIPNDELRLIMETLLSGDNL